MKKRNKSKILVPYLYLSPALISILVLTMIPMIYTVIISFTNYNLNNLVDYNFIGFDNYIQIVSGSLKHVFLPVFLWNIIYALIATFASFILGLFLAMLLNNSDMRESKVYKSILIVPWSLPGAIAILSWKGLLNESYGGINAILNAIGIKNVSWLTDPFFARVAILIVGLWLAYPFMLNVCLGVLQSIDPCLYEASEIDGATNLKKFIYITMPGIFYGTLPLIITSFAGNFNNFGTAYLITAGNPARLDTQYAGYTDILMSAGYKLTTRNFRYDLAAALSVIIFIIVGSLTLINMKMSNAFKEVD